MLDRMKEIALSARFAFRSPAGFARALHQAGSAFLNARFDGSSPISDLPPQWLAKLRRFEVRIPPPSLLIDGTQNVEGLIYLVSLAKACSAQSVFEIGTFTGVTALTLAMNLPSIKVHTLDLPAGNNATLTIDDADRKYLPKGSRRVYFGLPEAARIVQHEADSARFPFDDFRGQFDMVYVDGAHSYDYVANDTSAAFRIVSARGTIVWDDYQRCFPGVPRYLGARTDLRLFRLPGTRMILWLSPGADAAFQGSQLEPMSEDVAIRRHAG